MPDINNQDEKDLELLRVLQSRKSEADFYDQNQLSTQRQLSNYAYTGLQERLLQPTSGLTSVLVNRIKPSVDTLTAYMTKIFASDKETVVLNAHNPQASGYSSQLMDMVNHIIHKQNNGYTLMNRWVKDAALNKNGVVKVTWVNDAETYRETLENVSEEELNVYIASKEEQGKTVEVEKSTMVQEAVTQINPITEEEITVSSEMSSYELKVTCPPGRVLIENCPPEEFLINKESTSLDLDDNTFAFAAHTKLMFLGDIVKMAENNGWEISEEDLQRVSSGSDYLEYNSETEARHLFDGSFDYFTEDGNTDQMRQVELTESWLKIDYNGDGVVEWRHIFTVGDVILMNEEWTGMIPFFSFCFFPIPHKFYGMSVYDSIRDYYFQNTAVLRGTIDGIQRRNNPKVIFNPRDIPERNLQQAKTGYIAGGKTFGKANSFEVIPGGGIDPASLQMLEYIDRLIEEHLGINPRTGAISTDVEKSGNDALKTSQVIDNASTKVEMYAREFAEMSLRPMIWYIIQLIMENKTNYNIQKLAVKVSGAPFDGSIDIDKSDLMAKVGLGHLNPQQKVMAMGQLSATVQELQAAGVIVTPDKLLNKAYEMARGLGYENVYDFFPTPEEAMQNNQMFQQMIQQAQEQGVQMGMQQAMEQAKTQEIMAKIQKMTAEIHHLNAKTQSEMTDAEIAQREQLMKEREQRLEELIAMQAETKTATALI